MYYLVQLSCAPNTDVNSSRAHVEDSLESPMVRAVTCMDAWSSLTYILPELIVSAYPVCQGMRATSGVNPPADRGPWSYRTADLGKLEKERTSSSSSSSTKTRILPGACALVVQRREEWTPLLQCGET